MKKAISLSPSLPLSNRVKNSFSSNNNSNSRTTRGFTIVELLVVIVVIAILAAITIVSFTGISQKASLASIQSDLSNASNLLKMYFTEYGSYPIIATDSNCPSSPIVDNKYCLKLSPNNTKTYSPSTGTNSQTYNLNITNTITNTLGVATNDSKPIIPANTIAPLNPVADWLAIPTGEHYGNFYDPVTKQYATVTRTTPKTIYDPNTQKIYDVPANQLGIRPRSDNKSGYEAMIEEGRTNYALNSYFDLDSDSDGLSNGWVLFSSNVTGVPSYTRSPTTIGYGNYQQRVQYTGVSGDSTGDKWFAFAEPTANDTIAAGDVMTMSFYAKGSVAGMSISIYYRPETNAGTGTGSASTQTIVLTDTLKRYTMQTTAAPASTQRGQLGFYVTGIGTSDIIDISLSAVQLEKGSFVTSYIPTTTATVTRNSDIIKVPTANWSVNNGTWVAITEQPAYINNRFVLDWEGTNGQMRLYGYYPALYMNANSFYNPAQYIPSSGYMTQIGKYSSGSAVYAYINGVESSPGPIFNTAPTGMYSTAQIGGYGATSQYSGPIQRLAVYNLALSSSDVSTVTNSIKDGP